MKKLLFIWLFSGSLDGFSQAYNKLPAEYKYESWRYDDLVLRDSGLIFKDTIIAKLHVSSNRPRRMCYTLDGYVIFSSEHDPVYLDDNHLKLPSNLIVWQYKLYPTNKRRAKQ